MASQPCEDLGDLVGQSGALLRVEAPSDERPPDARAIGPLRASARMARVAAVSARAMSLRHLAEACFDFMSTSAQANSYQLVSACARSQVTGLRVTRLNASPSRAAVSGWREPTPLPRIAQVW